MIRIYSATAIAIISLTMNMIAARYMCVVLRSGLILKQKQVIISISTPSTEAVASHKFRPLHPHPPLEQ